MQCRGLDTVDDTKSCIGPKDPKLWEIIVNSVFWAMQPYRGLDI